MKDIETPGRQLDVEVLKQQLDTRIIGIGNRLLYKQVIDSTNTVAMHMAHNGSEEGVVVLADTQTAGRGRLGRRWIDTSGQHVLLSILLKPECPSYLLVMLASLAVVDTIAEVCGVIATIKWPNDILIGERKVAGILIETSHDRTGHMVAIIGIGINANGQWTQKSPEEAVFAALAITLETACGHTVSRETCIVSLLRFIELSYVTVQQEADTAICGHDGMSSASRLIRERWRSRLSTLGRTIQVQQGDTIIRGVAEAVNEFGELLLLCHSGEHVKITWGDILQEC